MRRVPKVNASTWRPARTAACRNMIIARAYGSIEPDTSTRKTSLRGTVLGADARRARSDGRRCASRWSQRAPEVELAPVVGRPEPAAIGAAASRAIRSTSARAATQLVGPEARRSRARAAARRRSRRPRSAAPRPRRRRRPRRRPPRSRTWWASTCLGSPAILRGHVQLHERRAVRRRAARGARSQKVANAASNASRSSRRDTIVQRSAQ